MKKLFIALVVGAMLMTAVPAMASTSAIGTAYTAEVVYEDAHMVTVIETEVGNNTSSTVLVRYSKTKANHDYLTKLGLPHVYKGKEYPRPTAQDTSTYIPPSKGITVKPKSN